MPKPKFQKPRNVDEFAEGANEEDTGRYPWEEPKVREDVNKNLPLYLPEPTALKLKYISQETGVPQQRILRDILIPEIEKRLKDLL